MSASFAGILEGWRARFGLAPGAGGAAEGKAPRGRRAAAAEAIPVREWISVESGQPARLLGFDRTLVCMIVGGPRRCQTGSVSFA